MLKIKKGVTCLDLEKFGTEWNYKNTQTSGCGNYKIFNYCIKDAHVLCINMVSREITNINYIALDILYDLIQAGLIEKEEDPKPIQVSDSDYNKYALWIPENEKWYIEHKLKDKGEKE